MKSIEKNDQVLLELSKEEAIVLLEWLSRFNEEQKPDSFHDQAEERVLWDMEASLEKAISDTVNVNYTEILWNARKKIRD